MEKKKAKLKYFKCSDCLSSMTSLDAPEVCACGGKLHLMGEVRGTTYGSTADLCACDHRCTNAAGPNCDCSCGGVNHGTGKTVETFTVLGKLTVKTVDKAATTRAAEYRASLEAAQKRFEVKHSAALEIAKTGAWNSDYAAWKSMDNDKKALSHAKNLQVHKTRLNALAKVCSDVSEQKAS